jgi:hypothetical protein
MVVWDSACLVLVAGLMWRVTVVLVVSPAPAVPTHDQRFAAVGIMVAAAAPLALRFLESWAVGPGVVKGIAAGLNLMCCGDF